MWDLTLLFVVLAGLYFFFIFFFKNRSATLFKKRKSKRAELAPIISNFLFHSPEDPKTEQREYVELKITIREYLSDKYFRKVLADILFDLQKDVAGATQERLYNLYVELGLHHDAYQKLSNWRWNTVSKGILELSQMKVTDAFHFISKFINDKRGVVRKQAEIAIISLKDEGINHLLDNTKYAISEWQQLRLIEALSSLKDYRPPKFKTWLISHNKDVVLFSLRLIKHFNQNEAAASITELVKHKNDQVKIAAISCIKDFNFNEANSVLKKVFWNCSAMVKVQILDTIGAIGDEGDLMFLNEIGKLESNFSVVNKAHAAINTISPDSILPTENIVEDLVAPITKSESGLYDVEFLETEVEYSEVVVKSEKTIETKEIEVEEIEVFNLVEKKEPKAKEETEEPIEAPDFKIQEMERELNKTLNFSLGLIDATALGKGEDESKETQEDYAQMSKEQRVKFVDTLESVGDKRETQLLEFIMEHEEDAELRFRAFNTLKSVGKKPEQAVEIVSKTITPSVEPTAKLEPEPLKLDGILPEESIFYDLYAYASDMNSKEILIQEIISIGDERDIPFLVQLQQTETDIIKTLVDKALETITKAISEKPLDDVLDNSVAEVAVDNAIDEIDFSALQTLVEEPETKPNTNTDSNGGLIPLELCFLYDELGILYDENNKKEDLGLNFELSKEFEVMVKSNNYSLQNE
ncbi:hypothetical protein [Croceitalea sp. P059]|uniref:hypothetical protein n=1 Tax=Croceitalea sp. P059 TaxID=3075601 RepID=UPI002884D09E|nr:hypothetical protein [Croceitalea sp. P059]MDT0539672.1 hypothetical protein [Croceitalea sp. P059]